ncbi:hypothetical protein [Nostoc sp.]|uniref:hypothetical protein n=1 Tax=Nostoc sp. TaxID=1180 RepID=UPI002FFD398A
MSGVRNWALIRQGLINGTSYNAEVNAHFGDTSADSGRNAAKNLCLITSTDSMQIALQRQSFFYYQVLKIQNKPIIIGQPKADFDADVKYHPQIFVRLWQDSTAVPVGKFPKSAQFSFRLLDETSETITKDKLNTYARKMYAAFFETQFTFNKGKYISWYTVPEEGLHLRFYCIDEVECERVAKAVVSKLEKVWNEDAFKISKPRRSNLVSSTNTINILGRSKQRPQWRPNCTVRSTECWACIWASDEEIPLVSKVGGTYRPIIRNST